jgi:tetratricopeptide (TPR) repeat protein
MELENVENRNILKEVYYYLRKLENIKARELVNSLLKENPTNEYAWLYLGIAQRRLKKLDDAIKCFETAVNLDNAMIEAWGLLTITYMDKNDKISATKTLKKAVKLNPENDTLRFYCKNLIRVYDKFGPFF